MEIGDFETKRTYAVAYAVWVSLRTPHIPRSEAAIPSKPPYRRGEPAAFATATGIGLSIYFRFVPFSLEHHLRQKPAFPCEIRNSDESSRRVPRWSRRHLQTGSFAIPYSPARNASTPEPASWQMSLSLPATDLADQKACYSSSYRDRHASSAVIIPKIGRGRTACSHARAITASIVRTAEIITQYDANG